MRSQSLPRKQASPNAWSAVATLLRIGSQSIRRSAQRARGREGKSLMFPLLGWRALMLRSFKEWRYNHKLWIRLKGATIYLTHFFRCWWPLQFQNASGERGTYRQWEWLEEKERRVCGNFESGQEGCTDDQERGKTSPSIWLIFNAYCTMCRLTHETCLLHLPQTPHTTLSALTVTEGAESQTLSPPFFFTNVLFRFAETVAERHIPKCENIRSNKKRWHVSSGVNSWWRNCGQHERWNIYYYYWN